MKTEVYLVYCYTKSGVQQFLEIESLASMGLIRDKLENFISFSSKKPIKKNLYPGAVFKIEKSEEGSYLFQKTMLPIESWPREDDRIKWRALEYAEKRATSLIKTLSTNSVHSALTPIKDAYRLSTVQGKQALLAEVLRFITG